MGDSIDEFRAEAGTSLGQPAGDADERLAKPEVAIGRPGRLQAEQQASHVDAVEGHPFRQPDGSARCGDPEWDVDAVAVELGEDVDEPAVLPVDVSRDVAHRPAGHVEMGVQAGQLEPRLANEAADERSRASWFDPEALETDVDLDHRPDRRRGRTVGDDVRLVEDRDDDVVSADLGDDLPVRAGPAVEHDRRADPEPRIAMASSTLATASMSAPAAEDRVGDRVSPKSVGVCF